MKMKSPADAEVSVEDLIVRNNGFTQEVSAVHASYPNLFLKTFAKLFDGKEITKEAVQKKFKKFCHKLCDEISAKYKELKPPVSKAPEKVAPKRRRGEETEKLRNDLRRDVYVLMRDIEGLKWWSYIEPIVQRNTRGKRARSLLAQRYTDVLHYILRDEKSGGTIILDGAAIGEVANQLAYAHRHEVPFPFLIGFLSEVHFETAATKERSGNWEDWYPHSKRRAKGQSAKPLTKPSSAVSSS